MKILIITQYFWPERFRINDLALGLKERGNTVHILTGKPNYPDGNFYPGYTFFTKQKEDWEGMTIFRSPLVRRGNGSGLNLMVNYLSFAFFSTIRSFLIKDTYDLIFVYEPSPITVGIPAIFLAKRLRIPMYFWVQDLWPESVTAAGQIKNRYILGQLDRLTRWVYANSRKILIQSEGFREYIRNQKVDNSKIIYYPNSTESLYKVVKPRQEIVNILPDVPFCVMFAGNIGDAQDFENIIEAARIVKDRNKNIHFVILGNGRKKDFVLQKIEEYDLAANFHVLGSFPVDTMPDFFARADALLVTLRESRIFSLTIPSKVQSYLACGKPILAALEGEGAKVILDAKAGMVAPPGNPEKLADKILLMYAQSPSERATMSENARRFFEKNFEREMLLDKLLEIVSDS